MRARRTGSARAWMAEEARRHGHLTCNQGPCVEHESGDLPFDQDFLLIDDVVTRGATLLAAAARLKATSPSARVRAFAVMRTVSNPEEFSALFSPVAGKIHLADSGECFRRP